MTHLESDVPSTNPAAPRRLRLALGPFLFGLSCAACGFLVALMIGALFHERLAQPPALLWSVTALAWVLVGVALYQLGRARACDRAIVMGGGLVSTLMSSLMFLE